MAGKKEKKYSRKNLKKTGGMWPFDNEPQDNNNNTSSDTNKDSESKKKEEIIKNLKDDPKNLICGVTDGIVGRRPTKLDPKILAAAMAENKTEDVKPVSQDEDVIEQVVEDESKPVSEIVPQSEDVDQDTVVDKNGVENEDVDQYRIPVEPAKPGGKRSSKKKSDKYKKKENKNKTKKVKGGKKNRKVKSKK